MTQALSSGEVLAVGIGSAGIRIASALSTEPLQIDRFAYISCDRSDLEAASGGERLLIDCPVDQKLNPSMVRGLAIPYLDSLRTMVGSAKVVLIMTGLGGAVGSGLAPMVAQLAGECGAVPVGVAVMPFDYEKKLRFYAGIALRRLRSTSKGVVVIDNEMLLKTSPDVTLKEIYTIANEEVVKALSCLLSKPTDSSIPAGVNKVLGTILQEGYSLLGMATSGSVDKTEDALARTVIAMSRIAETKEASHAVVVLSGDASLSASETGMAVKRLGSMMNNQAIDVEYSASFNGGSEMMVSVLASGFRKTKYDDYDPLAAIFGKNVIDDGMDTALLTGLERIEPCD
jgi:cell division protein FtsZ